MKYYEVITFDPMFREEVPSTFYVITNGDPKEKLDKHLGRGLEIIKINGPFELTDGTVLGDI
jgi:hypothetical protein